jgi:hypothetical protein
LERSVYRYLEFLKMMSLKDARVASEKIGHEAALHLKNWVWFYKVKQVLFSSHFEKRCVLLPKEVLVFSKLVWYISMYRTYVFGSILNRTAHLPELDEAVRVRQPKMRSVRLCL